MDRKLGRLLIGNFAVAVLLAAGVPTADATEIRQDRVARVKVRMGENLDRFTGHSVRLPAKLLKIRGGGMLTDVTFNPGIAQPPDGPPVAIAMVRYRGPGWIFLADTLHMLVDGQRLQVHGQALDNLRDVTLCSWDPCIVEEYARFPLSREILIQLANASSAEIRVNGQKASVEGALTEEHVAYVREVLRLLPAEDAAAESSSEAGQLGGTRAPAATQPWSPGQPATDPAKRITPDN